MNLKQSIIFLNTISFATTVGTQNETNTLHFLIISLWTKNFCSNILDFSRKYKASTGFDFPLQLPFDSRPIKTATNVFFSCDSRCFRWVNEQWVVEQMIISLDQSKFIFVHRIPRRINVLIAVSSFGAAAVHSVLKSYSNFLKEINDGKISFFYANDNSEIEKNDKTIRYKIEMKENTIISSRSVTCCSNIGTFFGDLLDTQSAKVMLYLEWNVQTRIQLT